MAGVVLQAVVDGDSLDVGRLGDRIRSVHQGGVLVVGGL